MPAPKNPDLVAIIEIGEENRIKELIGTFMEMAFEQLDLEEQEEQVLRDMHDRLLVTVLRATSSRDRASALSEMLHLVGKRLGSTRFEQYLGTVYDLVTRRLNGEPL